MLEPVELFDRRSLRVFISLLLLVFGLSVGWKYLQYRELTRFYNPLVHAQVLSQELRIIHHQPKMVMKFELDNGIHFIALMSPYLRDLRGREVVMEVIIPHLDFWEYLRGFFPLRASIEEVYPTRTLKERLYEQIASAHTHPWMQQLYGALFVATPLDHEFQRVVGARGLSAILSISGYHFALISGVLYALLAPIYTYFQRRYFPYRHRQRDLMLVIIILLWGYLWALEYIPPMVRSFGMIVLGYYLYDRGVKLISFETLLVSVAIIIAFFPLIALSWGFWFSVLGVWSIFVWVHHYGEGSKWMLFMALSFWCYIVLLPMPMVLFGDFSLWHIASIPLTWMFTFFYPLAFLLHWSAWGNGMDPWLLGLFAHTQWQHFELPHWIGWTEVVLLLFASRYRIALWGAGVYGIVFLGYLIEQVA